MPSGTFFDDFKSQYHDLRRKNTANDILNLIVAKSFLLKGEKVEITKIYEYEKFSEAMQAALKHKYDVYADFPKETRARLKEAIALAIAKYANTLSVSIPVDYDSETQTRNLVTEYNEVKGAGYITSPSWFGGGMVSESVILPDELSVVENLKKYIKTASEDFFKVRRKLNAFASVLNPKDGKGNDKTIESTFPVPVLKGILLYAANGEAIDEKEIDEIIKAAQIRATR